MTVLSRLSRSRLVRTVVVILVLVLAWQIYLSIMAPAKISPELAAEAEQGEPVRVTVVLNFEPERFHTLFLQDYGRVMGVSGDEVRLRDVRPESVAALARVYWIAELDPLGASE